MRRNKDNEDKRGRSNILTALFVFSTNVFSGKMVWQTNKPGFFLNSGVEPVKRKVSSVFCCGMQSLQGL